MSETKNPQNTTENKIPSVNEMLTMILLLKNKYQNLKNKTIQMIKKTYLEIDKYFKVKNLDVCKIKMDEIINKENSVYSLDILINSCFIIKEKIAFLMKGNQVPNNLRSYFDNILFGSQNFEIEEFPQFKQMLSNKFGKQFIQNCELNKDNFVNQNLIKLLEVKQNDENLIIYKLQLYANYRKFVFNFGDKFNNVSSSNIQNCNLSNQSFFKNLSFNNNMKEVDDCQYQGGQGFYPFNNNSFNKSNSANFNNNNINKNNSVNVNSNNINKNNSVNVNSNNINKNNSVNCSNNNNNNNSYRLLKDVSQISNANPQQMMNSINQNNSNIKQSKNEFHLLDSISTQASNISQQNISQSKNISNSSKMIKKSKTFNDSVTPTPECDNLSEPAEIDNLAESVKLNK